jgi:flagellar biosynthesis protein FlhF
LNIRKFIGATSRDALRLVREALGADAVVLSNRTNDDGSVEIVALADTDIAQIAPEAEPETGGPYAMPGFAQPAALGNAASPMSSGFSTGLSQGLPTNASAAQPMPGVMPANPYANGMPDVFSAVFGASPEVGAQPSAEARPAAAPLSRFAEREARIESRIESRSESRGDSKFGRNANGFAPAQPAPEAADADAATNGVAGAAADAQRSMAETNPWLLDHARRIAAQNERAAHTAKTHGMSPSAAAAKGLGAPGRVLSPEDLAEAAQPEWARQAAQSAARRRPATVEPVFDGTGALSRTRAQRAEEMADAVRARVEEMLKGTVMNELSSIRDMMEEQFAGLLWNDRQRRNPVQGEVTKQMFAAGFSAQLVRAVADKMPEVDSVEAGMEWAQSVLATNLPVLENEEALMERGGVFALMGPTGVGKTTTTAKLAARCVMRFGASKVALLTTDSYRIGGHEQLRIFGKILGVSVHAVKDAADLQLALTELRNKHIVLIDTIGMSQRDRTVSDQIAMLCGAGHPVQRLLLLNATSHGDTLNEVVQAYRSAPGQPDLAGCILTKLDEATNLGSVLDTVIRYQLPVHYVSTGQKVPENLYVGTKKFLLKSAFCIPRDGSPFVPHADDIPALLSALSTRTTAELNEVRFG